MLLATSKSQAAQPASTSSNLFAIGSSRSATYVTRQGASSHA